MPSSYENFFNEADKDGSKYLTLDELIAMLRKNGYKESDAKIKVGLCLIYYKAALSLIMLFL